MTATQPQPEGDAATAVPAAADRNSGDRTTGRADPRGGGAEAAVPAPAAGSGRAATPGHRPDPPEAPDIAGFAPVPLEEVEALMRFVAERGLDPDGSLLGPLYDAVARLEDAQDETARTAAEKDVLLGYSRLTGQIYPRDRINGATLIDCRHVHRHVAFIVALGCVFFILGIASNVLDLLFGSAGDPNGAIQGGWWNEGAALVLRNLEPFFWGGLGATVYLTKSLSDQAAAGTYTQSMVQGAGSRIFLGAIIGAIVANLFADPQRAEQDTQLTISALAFLSGLGVRAIYAAFERLIESIVTWIQPSGGGGTATGPGSGPGTGRRQPASGTPGSGGGSAGSGPSDDDRGGAARGTAAGTA